MKQQRLTPVNQQNLLKGRAPSGMPKLKKIRPARPVKKLPRQKQPARQTRKIREQPREVNGRFAGKPPVPERGFWGKLGALLSGEMGAYIAECQEECRKGQAKAARALLRETKANKSRRRGHQHD